MFTEEIAKQRVASVQVVVGQLWEVVDQDRVQAQVQGWHPVAGESIRGSGLDRVDHMERLVVALACRLFPLNSSCDIPNGTFEGSPFVPGFRLGNSRQAKASRTPVN